MSTKHLLCQPRCDLSLIPMSFSTRKSTFNIHTKQYLFGHTSCRTPAEGQHTNGGQRVGFMTSTFCLTDYIITSLPSFCRLFRSAGLRHDTSKSLLHHHHRQPAIDNEDQHNGLVGASLTAVMEPDANEQPTPSRAPALP